MPQIRRSRPGRVDRRRWSGWPALVPQAHGSKSCRSNWQTPRAAQWSSRRIPARAQQQEADDGFGIHDLPLADQGDRLHQRNLHDGEVFFLSVETVRHQIAGGVDVYRFGQKSWGRIEGGRVLDAVGTETDDAALVEPAAAERAFGGHEGAMVRNLSASTEKPLLVTLVERPGLADVWLRRCI